MCQVPRRTSKYRNWWSYKKQQDNSEFIEKSGCEKTLAIAEHKGPMIFEQCLNTLNDKPYIWSKTEEYPEFIPWRISKNLPIYNETSFY